MVRILALCYFQNILRLNEFFFLLFLFVGHFIHVKFWVALWTEISRKWFLQCVAVCCGVLRCVAVCCSDMRFSSLNLSSSLSCKISRMQSCKSGWAGTSSLSRGRRLDIGANDDVLRFCPPVPRAVDCRRSCCPLATLYAWFGQQTPFPDQNSTWVLAKIDVSLGSLAHTQEHLFMSMYLCSQAGSQRVFQLGKYIKLRLLFRLLHVLNTRAGPKRRPRLLNKLLQVLNTETGCTMHEESCLL